VNVEKPKKAKMQATPVFTKKENATLTQCIEVLDWYHANGKNQSKTAKHFELVYPNIMIKQPLVSAWVKNENKWRDDMERSHDSHNNVKCTHQTQHPEVTEMMDLWVLAAMADRINLTGEVLHQKWSTFADMVGIPEEDRLNMSDVKAWHNLKEIKCHGDAGSAIPSTVEAEQKLMKEFIKKSKYELRDIFNMDETGLFYA
jgi:hypothetical protein